MTVRVHLYAQCKNDEFMLPFFFRHYDTFVDRYVIYDDGSTDRTLSILARHPKVEVRRFVRSVPGSFVLSEQALSDDCWKESRGSADWVIVTDIDEHLFHSSIVDYLQLCSSHGVTVIPALGFQMLSEKVPEPHETLCETYTLGAPWEKMMKLSIFDPGQISEIHYASGRHYASPEGVVRMPPRDELLLLHYKYLGIHRTHSHHQTLRMGLGAEDLRNGFGRKYMWSLQELESDWKRFAAHAIDVSKVRDFSSYPLEKWWEKGATE